MILLVLQRKLVITYFPTGMYLIAGYWHGVEYLTMGLLLYCTPFDLLFHLIIS